MKTITTSSAAPMSSEPPYLLKNSVITIPPLLKQLLLSFACTGSNHNLTRHFLADRNTGFFNVYKQIAADGGYHRDAAARYKPEIFKMRPHLRLSPDLPNHIFLTDIGKC